MLTVAPAAHHSAAATYEADQTLTIAGTVLEFAWRNPHCHVQVQVASGPFGGRRYSVEMSSAESLASTGWTRTQLRPGDAVVFDVHPSRSGGPVGLCRDCRVTINGRVLRLRTSRVS